MNNGIWQIDGDRRTQLSANPDALNPRVVARALQHVLADANIDVADAQGAMQWLDWMTLLCIDAGIDPLTLQAIGAIRDGMERYAELGAPRTVPTVPAPDDPGEQAAF